MSSESERGERPRASPGEEGALTALALLLLVGAVRLAVWFSLPTMVLSLRPAVQHKFLRVRTMRPLPNVDAAGLHMCLSFPLPLVPYLCMLNAAPFPLTHD